MLNIGGLSELDVKISCLFAIATKLHKFPTTRGRIGFVGRRREAYPQPVQISDKPLL